MYFLYLAACASGFIGLETLAGLATFTRLNDERQSVYPAINFTCDGSITSWTVLARRRDTFGFQNVYPDLQVWRREGGGAYTRVGSTTLSRRRNNRQDDIYEYVLDNPLRFQAGDMFGMFQPRETISRLRIHEQQGGGPLSFYMETRSATGTLDEDTATEFHDYPLITVTTGRTACLSVVHSKCTHRQIKTIAPK